MFLRIRHGETNHMIYLFPDNRTASAQLKNFSYYKINFQSHPTTRVNDRHWHHSREYQIHAL